MLTGFSPCCFHLGQANSLIHHPSVGCADWSNGAIASCLTQDTERLLLGQATFMCHGDFFDGVALSVLNW